MKLPVRTSTSREPRLREHHGRKGELVVPESPLQRLILDWLALAGIKHTVTDAARVATKNDAGETTLVESAVRTSWPDVTGCLPGRGRILLVETKAVDGRYRKGQHELHEALRADGALVVVPRRLGDLVEAIELEYGADILTRERWHLRRAVAAYHAGTGAR